MSTDYAGQQWTQFGNRPLALPFQSRNKATHDQIIGVGWYSALQEWMDFLESPPGIAVTRGSSPSSYYKQMLDARRSYPIRFSKDDQAISCSHSDLDWGVPETGTWSRFIVPVSGIYFLNYSFVGFNGPKGADFQQSIYARVEINGDPQILGATWSRTTGSAALASVDGLGGNAAGLYNLRQGDVIELMADFDWPTDVDAARCELMARINILWMRDSPQYDTPETGNTVQGGTVFDIADLDVINSNIEWLARRPSVKATNQEATDLTNNSTTQVDIDQAIWDTTGDMFDSATNQLKVDALTDGTWLIIATAITEGPHDHTTAGAYRRGLQIDDPGSNEFGTNNTCHMTQCLQVMETAITTTRIVEVADGEAIDIDAHQQNPAGDELVCKVEVAAIWLGKQISTGTSRTAAPAGPIITIGDVIASTFWDDINDRIQGLLRRTQCKVYHAQRLLSNLVYTDTTGCMDVVHATRTFLDFDIGGSGYDSAVMEYDTSGMLPASGAFHGWADLPDDTDFADYKEENYGIWICLIGMRMEDDGNTGGKISMAYSAATANNVEPGCFMYNGHDQRDDQADRQDFISAMPVFVGQQPGDLETLYFVYRYDTAGAFVEAKLGANMTMHHLGGFGKHWREY